VTSAIGPVWNGNEVWLIAAGAAHYFLGEGTEEPPR
jgi:cytochrome bd-type quinol oxidase subunit 2